MPSESGGFLIRTVFGSSFPRKQQPKIPSFPRRRKSSLSGFSDFRHISTRFDSVISPVSVIADNTVVFSFPDSRLRGNDGGRLAVFPDKSLRLLIAGFRLLGNNGI
ncbi:hypothetical protein [Neisseria lactamica]|uniref:hypothetical protein n=1 Tax=Neisseria lactamica TaxID=486 RepID=UPI0015F00155|nr:hypothetical protein [Neisseria lactamica]